MPLNRNNNHSYKSSFKHKLLRYGLILKILWVHFHVNSVCNVYASSAGQTLLWVTGFTEDVFTEKIVYCWECFQAALKHVFVLCFNLDSMKCQYKVDLVSSMNQLLFPSWGKKKSNPVRLQWLRSMTVIIDLLSMYFFFKEVKRSTEVLVYLFEILLYFCRKKITCASIIPFNFFDTE